MFLLIAALFSFAAAEAALPAPAPAKAKYAKGGCDYTGSWSSIDDFQRAPGTPAEARSVVESRGLLFVAGQADSRWVVRRSDDGGATWKIADEFSYKGKGASARSIAADPRNGYLYAVGHGVDEDNDFHWLVRRSLDGGRSWATMQDIRGKEDYAMAEGVAVDGKGIVYVTGAVNAGDPGVSRWTTQRSVDAGKTWVTVDEVATSKNATGLSVVADKQGRVFVGGSLNDERAFTWTVRSSVTGQRDWKTVDRFQLPGGKISQAVGSALSDGRVAFAGYAVDSAAHSHWIVRKARVSRPDSWWTADDFVSDRSRSQARASAVAFTSDDRVVATGKIVVSGGEFDFLFTRFGSNDSEMLQGSPAFEDKDQTMGNALTALKNGDLIMAGSVTVGQNKWIVRRLACDGDTQLRLVRSPADAAPISRPDAPKQSNSAYRR